MGKPRCHPDPFLNCEVKIADAKEEDSLGGQRGELLLRNPALMVGYFRDPLATEQCIRDGWLHTGDLVRRDQDGFYYFEDRRGGIIRRRGENVSAREVERVLEGIAGVAEASVLGVPSELYEEDILAVIVPRSGESIDLAEVVSACGAMLTAFKIPRYLQVMNELPCTETHKIDYREMRRKVAGGKTWFDREANSIVQIPETLRSELVSTPCRTLR